MNLDFDQQSYTVSGKLDTFSQLHVARKLAPAMPIIEGLIDPRNADKDKGILIVLMMSHISDSDVEYVLKKCMSVVTRKGTDGRSTRILAQNGDFMYDDIKLETMLALAVAVIDLNLGDFFRTALADMAKVSREAQS